MFSNFSFSSRLAFFGSRQSLCQNSAVCSIQKGLDNQITSKHIQAPQIRLNTTQIPSDTPRGTPQTYPDNTRRQQMPTDTSRHQQTLPDSSKNTWQCPLVSVAVCWSLLLSIGVCCCLLVSCVVWKCMWGVYVVAWGYLNGICGCLGFSDVFGSYLSAESLQNGANYAIVGQPWKNKIFSTDYNETSKYQNVRISASQKSLGYAICLIC